MQKNPIIGIIMGSDSDLAVMQEAAKVLEDFKVPYELTIISAHRTPERALKYAKNARNRWIKVIIAGAGGAAHLPGVIAAITTLPVIGVPIKTSTLSGVDSLYSIVQMPKGIPVACVGINSSANAALLAVRILATYTPDLSNKMVLYQQKLKKSVEEKAKRLEKIGYLKYLKRL